MDKIIGKMSIIDYYGMVDDNKDITYVIFCERMRVLCSTDYTQLAQHGGNPSVSIGNRLVSNTF